MQIVSRSQLEIGPIELRIFNLVVSEIHLCIFQIAERVKFMFPPANEKAVV